MQFLHPTRRDRRSNTPGTARHDLVDLPPIPAQIERSDAHSFARDPRPILGRHVRRIGYRQPILDQPDADVSARRRQTTRTRSYQSRSRGVPATVLLPTYSASASVAFWPQG